MNTINKPSKRMKYLKYGAVGLVAFTIGGASASTPKTVYKDKPVEVVKTVDKVKVAYRDRNVTPQSCKDVIATDNELFVKTGEALENVFDPSGFIALNAYMDANMDSRTANAINCLNNK